MKLGIALQNWGLSEVSFLALKQANRLLEDGGVLDNSIIGFYENLAHPPIIPHFAMMQTYECYGFEGAVITTDINTTRKLLNCPSPKAKVYYIYDIEWFRLKQKQYKNSAKIYTNPELILITRCEAYAHLLRNCYNRDAQVVPDFNLKEIIKIIDAQDQGR